jgi:hypothetical protein
MESLEMSLTNARFVEVASGTGQLDATGLQPGIYELRLAAGPSTDSRLISLRPGVEHHERVELTFPSAMPLPRTTTWNKIHETAAVHASEYVVHAADDRSTGGLVVIARSTGEASGRSSPSLRFSLEPGLNTTPKAAARWWLDRGEDWSVQAAPVEPGGYILRTHSDSITVEQSLWVADGWQTLVFVPVEGGELVPSRSSVAMFAVDRIWEPALAERTWHATELLLWGLRERRSVMPSDLLDLLLNEKYTDPMLGVLGAHAILLEPTIDFERLRTVLGNLEELLPGAPDVLALRALHDEAIPTGETQLGAGEQRADRPAPRLAWPPMLLLGYTALIRLDAQLGGTLIVPGSPAQSIAGRLTGDGGWTAWTVEEPVPGKRRRRRSAPRGKRRGAALGNALREVDVSEPAGQRIVDYLTSIADVENPEDLNEMLATEIAEPTSVSAATSVPLRSVRETFDVIRDALD